MNIKNKFFRLYCDLTDIINQVDQGIDKNEELISALYSFRDSLDKVESEVCATEQLNIANDIMVEDEEVLRKLGE